MVRVVSVVFYLALRRQIAGMNKNPIGGNGQRSPGPTLVIADYPIGYASGFGETLYNLFSGFPNDRLWSAHPGHITAADNKQRGQSVCLPSPSRPSWLPNVAKLAYYPLLKTQQLQAARSSLQLLSEVVEKNSIKNLLVIPVSPWILSAARVLHKRHPKLNLVFYVMDDWQGHHECHQLPYYHWRRRLLREIIDRAGTRFAVSREMAAHYEETFGKSWLVAITECGQTVTCLKRMEQEVETGAVGR